MIRFHSIGWIVAAALSSSAALADTHEPHHLNPVIQLLEQHKPVMGLYAPGNRGHGAAEGEMPPLVGHDTPQELAKKTLAYKSSDFVFVGSMEYHYDELFPEFADYAAALRDAGPLSHTKPVHLAYPIIAKIPLIAPEPGKVVDHISKQLNAGTSGVMFVGTESAAEVEQGLAAMRFASKGGTRPDDVGSAPAYWGMSEQEYRRKADLWPLNPHGELINWTIIESKEGLKHVREIAAVKGIGVLWPGAGTLRGVFSTKGPDGKRVVDQVAWEAAIQQVLAACKEFHVPCGFPAGPNDIEMRMKQGFTVFVSQFNESGMQAVTLGRKAAGRPPANE
jgi:2-keto-3-deoxy-L-rhamnonate aldolase RhmA